MEISKLSTRIVTEEMERGGEKCSLTFDADAFTPEFLRGVAAAFKQKFAELTRQDKLAAKRRKSARGVEKTLLPFEDQARVEEVHREVYVDLLFPNILKAWGVTNSGQAVKLTRAALMSLPPRTVKEIYTFCVNNSGPK